MKYRASVWLNDGPTAQGAYTQGDALHKIEGFFHLSGVDPVGALERLEAIGNHASLDDAHRAWPARERELSMGDIVTLSGAPGRGVAAVLGWQRLPPAPELRCPSCNGEAELNGRGGLSCFFCGYDGPAPL